MRTARRLFAISAALLLTFTPTLSQSPSIAVGPQYDSTHVYVAPADFDKFVASFINTFGGHATEKFATNVLPVPSTMTFQAVSTPVGTLSVFAFQTPIPYPFGGERTVFAVTNMDAALTTARAAGAAVLVAPFKDAIGTDAVIQFPGGINTQLYAHFKPGASAPLQTIPDNRVYISQDRADAFVKSFLTFANGRVIADDSHADAGEIGRPEETYRRIRITSLFGNTQVLVTDGHLPYPFGREITGYEVSDLAATLDKARSAGAKVLSAPFKTKDRTTAVVQFPGGYIAEIHGISKP
jgi:predicted enzyme related to lactoylglutathione lyase